MNIILFEDNDIELLKPFTLNHASFELRCGAFTNIERVQLIKDINLVLIVRNHLKPIIKERYPQFDVNPEYIPEGICINGSVCIDENIFSIITEKETISHKGKLISFNNDSKLMLNDFSERTHSALLVSKDVEISTNSYLWDVINNSTKYLKKDIKYFSKQNEFILHPSAVTNKLENIYFGKNVLIKAGAILDAANGPIIIDDHAEINNGAILEGPLYIGKQTIISSGAKIKENTCIGPLCKIGGEITSTIFQGYSNKVHDGFLGHSYVGEWVNIGAGTNNSNLKNNYSKVKFNFGGGSFDTDEQFLGTMIGDYTRIGIGTMINTGTYIGLGSNIFGEGFQPKFIDSFMWDKNTKVNLDRFLTTIKKMKLRRNIKVSDSELDYIKFIYD